MGTASSAESSVVVLSIDLPPDAAATAAEAEERREEAATASISLKLRLSLTRSDKLLTEISEKKIQLNIENSDSRVPLCIIPFSQIY